MLRRFLLKGAIEGVEDPLLHELEARREDVHVAAITVPQLLVAPELRKPLMIVCFAMLSQQLSGRPQLPFYSCFWLNPPISF